MGRENIPAFFVKKKTGAFIFCLLVKEIHIPDCSIPYFWARHFASENKLKKSKSSWL
jgi:hypothetical protein